MTDSKNRGPERRKRASTKEPILLDLLDEYREKTEMTKDRVFLKNLNDYRNLHSKDVLDGPSRRTIDGILKTGTATPARQKEISGCINYWIEKLELDIPLLGESLDKWPRNYPRVQEHQTADPFEVVNIPDVEVKPGTNIVPAGDLATCTTDEDDHSPDVSPIPVVIAEPRTDRWLMGDLIKFGVKLAVIAAKEMPKVAAKVNSYADNSPNKQTYLRYPNSRCIE